MARKLETLEDLYVDELRDLFSAETQLVKAIPEMEKAAKGSDLSKAFREDIGRTERHLERLQEVFKRLEKEPAGHHCKGMEGLLEEGRELMTRGSEPHVVDAGLIVMAQKAQHYEIAGYGSACTFATLLNRQEEAHLLHDTLEEEKLADAHFTQIALKSINVAAPTP